MVCGGRTAEKYTVSVKGVDRKRWCGSSVVEQFADIEKVGDSTSPRTTMIVISDLHIGRKDCMIDELVAFIEDNPTDLLVLNGDIFDQFARDGLWKEHWAKVKYLRKYLKMMHTGIIYLIGNHDYLMFLLIPFGKLLGIKIRKRVVIGEYLIEHGDWISYYLKLRGFKTGTYHENCELFAVIKGKKLLVGHSHYPHEGYRVIDVGDWVEHGTYFNSEDNTTA